MRAATMPTVLLTFAFATLAACGSDTLHDPLAPMAPTRASLISNAAETKTMSIRGTLEAHETDTYQPATNSLVVHLEGTGTASHIGRFTVVDDGIGFLSTGLGEGRITFTAANGDSFTATETGHAEIAGGIAEVTDEATITGGTGRFAHATGTLTIQRRLDLATGLSTGSFEGTINLAK